MSDEEIIQRTIDRFKSAIKTQLEAHEDGFRTKYEETWIIGQSTYNLAPERFEEVAKHYGYTIRTYRDTD